VLYTRIVLACTISYFCVYYVLCVVCVFSFAAFPSVWYCWLGLLTCRNRLPYNLYCVGGDVKHCSINQSTLFRNLKPITLNQSLRVGKNTLHRAVSLPQHCYTVTSIILMNLIELICIRLVYSNTTWPSPIQYRD